ncbi:uncharacterized protein TNCV_2365111 [Trichonephila clavipes]|nr:uncharacterized protein TNCV_2365111 [Trichonephila clavipes]
MVSHSGDLSCSQSSLTISRSVGKSIRRTQKSDAKLVSINIILLCSATRGLLATDLVVWNHGQVTRSPPELAPVSPNYHTTPKRGNFELTTDFKCIALKHTEGFSDIGLELMTRQARSDTLTTRLPRPSHKL